MESMPVQNVTLSYCGKTCAARAPADEMQAAKLKKRHLKARWLMVSIDLKSNILEYS
jgi:hypothetical protein